MPPPPPASVLTIVAKPPLGRAWITPRADINRYPVGLRWGVNTVVVPPGVHHVAIHMPWLWRYGEAEITVDNRNDPAATIYYAAPILSFGSGAIGFFPVKSPGFALHISLLIAAPLLLLCACLGTTLL